MNDVLPKPAAPTTAGSSSAMPQDIATGATFRLVVCMLVIAAVNVVYVTLYRTVWVDHSHWLGFFSGSGMVVASLLLAWHVHSCRHTQRRVIFVGLAYEVITCFEINLVEMYSSHTATADLISWSCVVIVFFPVLVPATRRATLIASLLSALMAPVAWLVVAGVRGDFGAEAGALLSRFLPPFLCVPMAVVGSRFITKLGAEVSQARRLGSYELVERLGQGGMGEVWRARHQLLARPAAIKLIKRDALGSSDGEGARRLIERFEREAQATASLESPHTVQLYDFGIAEDGTFYYVMELLRGVDLETLVGTFGPLPAERVVHILVQVCDSLQDAHESDLVHRDIKPANIHIGTRAGRRDFVRVLDFGLVKEAANAVVDVGTSRADEIKGTPSYMAPEAATGESEVTARSDLYSLGCVAYFLLTGELVFDEKTPMKMIVAHATAEPTKPSLRTELSIPEALEGAVLACLAKSPEDRPASAAELAAVLGAIELSAEWTGDRAESWWQEHVPDGAIASESLVTPESNLARTLAPAALRDAG